MLPTIRSRCSALYLKPVPKVRPGGTTGPATMPLTPIRQSGWPASPAVALARRLSALRDSQALWSSGKPTWKAFDSRSAKAGLDIRFDYAAEVATQFGRDREGGQGTAVPLAALVAGPAAGQGGCRGVPAQRRPGRRPAPTGHPASTADVVAFIKRINRALEALDANANSPVDTGNADAGAAGGMRTHSIRVFSSSLVDQRAVSCRKLCRVRPKKHSGGSITTPRYELYFAAV